MWKIDVIFFFSRLLLLFLDYGYDLIGHLWSFSTYIFKGAQIKISQSISLKHSIKTESWLKMEKIQFCLYIPDYAL